MRAALARTGITLPAVIAYPFPGSRFTGSISGVAGRVSAVAGTAVGAITVPASLDIGVNLIRFPGPFAHVVTERPGLGGLLVRLLAQACGFDLCLFCIRPGTCCLGLALTGIPVPCPGPRVGFPQPSRGARRPAFAGSPSGAVLLRAAAAQSAPPQLWQLLPKPTELCPKYPPLPPRCDRAGGGHSG